MIPPAASPTHVAVAPLRLGFTAGGSFSPSLVPSFPHNPPTIWSPWESLSVHTHCIAHRTAHVHTQIRCPIPPAPRAALPIHPHTSPYISIPPPWSASPATRSLSSPATIRSTTKPPPNHQASSDPQTASLSNLQIMRSAIGGGVDFEETRWFGGLREGGDRRVATPQGQRSTSSPLPAAIPLPADIPLSTTSPLRSTDPATRDSETRRLGDSVARWLAPLML